MQEHICPNCFEKKDPETKFCPNCGFNEQQNLEKYPVALPAGTILAGRYIVGRVLGQGGFGITYLAQDYKTKEKVALKEYFPETLVTRTDRITVSSYAGEREENFTYGKDCFLDEAKTLAEFLGNDNIVKVYSYFEENGTAYFAMEYIEGESLQDYIGRRGGTISFDDAKRLLFPVMDALSIVHSKGIVHRDISPDNIYLCKDNKIKLLDFGAARYSLGDKSRSLDIVLKHGYAPKEQYTRHGRQGPFTDVYSIAATFYRAITGQVPPDSIDRIDHDELRTPSSLGVMIPKKAEEALLKALAVQPSDRFQNIAAFKNAMTIATASQAQPSSVKSEQSGGITFFSQTDPSSQTPAGGSGASGVPNTGTSAQPVSGYPTSGTQGTYTPVSGTQSAPVSSSGERAPQKKRKPWLIPVIIVGAITLTVLLLIISIASCASCLGSSVNTTPTYADYTYNNDYTYATEYTDETASPETAAPEMETVHTVENHSLWSISLEAANTDENDLETVMNEVSTDEDYFHIVFAVNGGDDDNPINVAYFVSHSSGYTAEKVWEDVTTEKNLQIYWDGGFESADAGVVTITLYNQETKEYFCSYTFEIFDPDADTTAENKGGTASEGEFYIGDTWKVDGLFSLTVNSVKEVSDRNAEAADVVYLIDYTYTNYGIEGDGLYFGWPYNTVDSAGKNAQFYYIDKYNWPDYIAVGETLHCQETIAVSKKGTLTATQTRYDAADSYKAYQATFILEPD